LHELFIVFKHRPEYGDTELIILGNINVVDLLECEKLLVIREDFLEEVLVDHILWREIKLAIDTRVRLHTSTWYLQ
jgi:hypothetical protein